MGTARSSSAYSRSLALSRAHVRAPPRALSSSPASTLSLSLSPGRETKRVGAGERSLPLPVSDPRTFCAPLHVRWPDHVFAPVHSPPFVGPSAARLFAWLVVSSVPVEDRNTLAGTSATAWRGWRMPSVARLLLSSDREWQATLVCRSCAAVHAFI